MTNNPTTQLHRSDTFPYDGKDYNDINYHAIETAEGWYSVIIDPDTDDFILTTPFGKQVEDNLHEYHKRKDLYSHYEEGMIYEWLYHIRERVNRYRSNNHEAHTWFKIDDRKYMMRLNKQSGVVKLSLPAQTRVFDVSAMYEDNIDLCVIQEGQLDQELRRRLIKSGFELPDAPFQIGYNISEK